MQVVHIMYDIYVALSEHVEQSALMQKFMFLEVSLYYCCF